MKNLSAIVAAVFFSGFLIATVNAGPNDNSASPQKSSQSAPKKKTRLSKGNRAKIEVQQKKAERNAQIANTTQK